MALVFAAVFLIADPVTALMDALVGLARSGLVRVFGKGLVSSFLADGVIGGAGTVLAFMPQIVILTVALELLEASGYLARGAFLVDRALRLLGLSGRSFLPLLMGHACAIPAISATRVVRDPARNGSHHHPRHPADDVLRAPADPTRSSSARSSAA